MSLIVKANICPFFFVCSLVEIKGSQGKDLTIPCTAPLYLNNPSLQWIFFNGEEPLSILTYDSQSGKSTPPQPWNIHVEMDAYKVPFGDGSLRLMDPKRLEHTGIFTCMFSMPYSTYTERTVVTIADPSGEITQQHNNTLNFWLKDKSDASLYMYLCI